MNANLTPVRVNPVLVHPEERRSKLDGEWGFRLDPRDTGVQERWYDHPEIFTDKITVPGCWQGQGFGSDARETIWDFKLEARTFRATYEGTGWYGRSLDIPADWKGRRIWLNFGSVFPSADVWINGVKLGSNNLPFVPFGFEITNQVRYEAGNWIAVRVHEENRLYGLCFNWQGHWSGLYRGVDITATGPSCLEQFRIYPDVEGQVMRFKVLVGGFDNRESSMVLRIRIHPLGHDQAPLGKEFEVLSGEGEYAVAVPFPNLWSPDTPNLYRVDASLVNQMGVSDALSERTGFVMFSTAGEHFRINGEPYYMRGTGDFLTNPETGCPDTDRDRWRKKLTALRDYGYNFVRCQSFVPAPEYFDVADEVGLLVQSEMGILGAWGGTNSWHTYFWPQPTPAHRDNLKRQWDLVVLRDINHPSANIYCMSNELMSGTCFPRTAWQCYHETKAIKPTALVLWTDGGYDKDLPGDFVNWEPTMKDYPYDKPLIQHEFRWWSSFPDVRIMSKYSGALRPYSAEIAIEAAARHQISDILPLAAKNSQRLQFIEAKGKMETCRRDNSKLAGICHFNAMDTTPSPQGIIDEFYERKFADSPLWRETNGDTVIMCSLGFDDRVLSSGDLFRCSLHVSDYSHPPLKNPVLKWKLLVDTGVLAEGQIDYRHHSYCTCEAGTLQLTIPEISRAAKACLQAELREGERSFSNRWDLWLFPKTSTRRSSVCVYGKPQHSWLQGVSEAETVAVDMLPSLRRHLVMTERCDDPILEFIRAGGRVFLAASEGLVRPFPPKLGLGVGRYFFTIPANYGPYEDGHDGSIVLNHPMLGDFPHEGFGDLQFYRLFSEKPPLDLEPLGLNKINPIIRAIHSYPVCRPLGYLMEGSIGKGRLIISVLDLNQAWVEARYLLEQICGYALAENSYPQTKLTLTDKTVEMLMQVGRIM